MESKDGSVQESAGNNVSELENLKLNRDLDELIALLDLLIKKLNQAYPRNDPNTPEGGSMVGDEDRERFVESSKKRQPTKMGIANAQRTPKLMHEFGTILHEEQRQKEEDSGMEIDNYLSVEAANAKTVRDLAPEIVEIDISDTVYEKCRKMTVVEKKKLGVAIAQLSHESIDKANQFIAAKDPNFEGIGETVEIDLDAQSDSTLWLLKSFVEYSLQEQRRSSSNGGGII